MVPKPREGYLSRFLRLRGWSVCLHCCDPFRFIARFLFPKRFPRRFVHESVIRRLCDVKSKQQVEWDRRTSRPDLIESPNSDSIVRRSALLFLFQRDLLKSETAKQLFDIVIKGEEKVMKRRVVVGQPDLDRPKYGKWSVCGWIYLSVLHGAMLGFILYCGFQGGSGFQVAAEVTLIVWTLTDLVLVSTLSMLLQHYVMHSCMARAVFQATEKCHEHFSFWQGLTDSGGDQMSDEVGIGNGREEDSLEDMDSIGSEENRTKVTSDGFIFNALHYYWLSSRSALTCPDLRESRIIRDLTCVFPGQMDKYISMRSNFQYTNWTDRSWDIWTTIVCFLAMAINGLVGQFLAEVVSIVAAAALLWAHLQLYWSSVPLLVVAPSVLIAIAVIIAVAVDSISTRNRLTSRTDLYRCNKSTFYNK